MVGVTTSADPAPAPADPNAASCAALSTVQPAIDDLRDKVNAYLSNQAPAEETAPTSPNATTTSGTHPGATTTSPAPANAKIDHIVQSLRHLSSELKTANPAIKDAQLRNSASTLATTVDNAANSVSAANTAKTGGPNLVQLGSLGINITSAAAFYQINENRVCAGAPPAQPAPSPAAPQPSPAPKKAH
ncbi:conserved hypothetical protein [Segniliparus rotundus DSM 44985]|uniref:Uncharacterized protein n=1 Tax=Segniliparus rotundus (strain ATCC BAA-972 / CDC 1076 / CIP 108378 / DSM 44985 / JCM 13578) TaxID=640132 RepID=D6Z864_SEGRD|nr:conserved hypothetical protein [Segniliparus rotundus DSM 44985]